MHMMRGAATCAVSRLVVLLGGLVVVHGQEAPCVVLLANCAAADGDPCVAAAGDGMDCSALVERAMSGKRCTPEQRHELLMLVSMGIHNQRCHIDVSDIVSQQHRRALLRGGGPGDTVASMRWTQRRGLQDTGGVLCQTAEQFLALVATVNIACCGSRDGCGDGFPTTCTMSCAAEYLPFIERCHEQLQSYTQGVSSMQPYDTFQLVCSAMDTGQLARALDEMWCTPPPPPATTVRSLCIIAFAIHIIA